MSPHRFDHLLSLIEPFITKKSTCAGERLPLTLRSLATGESQQSLSFAYRIGKATVSKILRETCDAIYKLVAPAYLRPPSTKEDWIAIASDFENIWNLPHVIGAIDGKHIRIMFPAHTGTQFHNYKGFLAYNF